MNHIIIFKSLAAAAFALGTLTAATTAHARNDVEFAVTVGSPGAHVRHAPVYGQHRPVYVQPRPVYSQPRPVHVQHAPVYVHHRPPYAQPAPVHSWGHQRHNHHGRNMNAHRPRGDFDHDGIPNRFDRFPGNPNWR